MIRPLQQAWSTWPLISQHKWELYVTLTFPTVTKADRATTLWRKFTDKTAKMVLPCRKARTQGLPWVCAIEQHKSGSSHIHALLSGVECLSFDQLAEQWRKTSGSKIIDIRAFQPTGNALSYIAKTADSGGDIVVARYFNYV
jgi:hypothetical protein